MQQVVEIIFALVFLAILAMIHLNILGIGDTINAQLGRTASVTETPEIVLFDDTTVSGSTVKNAIANCNTIYDYNLEIVVDLDGATATYDVSHPYTATNISDINFIKSDSLFSSELQKSKNGLITSILFTEI
jgi:hypothetical protein